MERNPFSLARVHADKRVALVLVRHATDALEHLREMPLDLLDILGVTDNLKQVLVTHEVEAGEVLSLLLEVLTESFLDHL